ncbi:MAG: SIR2 family protein [Chloroflexota bacterium]
MIFESTLLILGAAASKPYGFPLGGELKEQIICELSKQYGAFCTDVMNACGCTWDVVDEFREKFEASNFPSIDRFLESETEVFVKIGKVCIARALIPCEVQAELNSQEDERWYGGFFEKLLPNNPNEFSKNGLSVVTYNYDRSFEQCLFSTIREKYKFTDTDTATMFNHIEILHLHGVLGQLPSSSLKPHESSRPYSSEVSVQVLRDCASEIIVLHEADYERLSQHGFPTAQHLIDNAKVVCFLGFGYHDRILDAIFQRNTSKAQSMCKRQMLGTCIGRAAPDQQAEIKDRFDKLELYDLTVKDALNQWDELIY